MRRLVLLNPEFNNKMFRASDGLTIGSGDEAKITARSKKLEAIHARFEVIDGSMHIKPASDSAHIFVNGQDVLSAELNHLDEIVVGPLKIRYEDDSMVSHGELNIDNLINEYEQTMTSKVYDFMKEDLFYLISKNPELRNAIAFSLPSRDRFIDQAQAFLSRIANQAGFDEFKHEAFMTCVKELILNAHRHGHNYDNEKTITVRYKDNGPSVTLTIEDQGDGFDHKGRIESIQGTDAASAARERYQAGGFGGLGFTMILKMCEELKYNDKGNIVTFTVTKQL